MNRRQWFVSSLSLAAWPEIVAAQAQVRHALESGTPPTFLYLDVHSAAEIDALADQIIPSDDSPGARTAGVIYFIDRALATFDQDLRELYQTGLQNAQKSRKHLVPKSESIAGLSAAERIDLLREIERTEFFQILRTHTIAGFLADPSYGGNRNQVGWKLIGFDNEHVHHPPFGYYDAEATRGDA